MKDSFQKYVLDLAGTRHQNCILHYSRVGKGQDVDLLLSTEQQQVSSPWLLQFGAEWDKTRCSSILEILVHGTKWVWSS